MNEDRAKLRRMMPSTFPIFFEGRKPYEGQTAAMPEIVKGHDVLFASPTATGKTEAAIAPFCNDICRFGGRRSQLSMSHRPRRL